ncbi:MAG TPA: hypothetical protein PLX06_01850 [Fimbriimonadaceae bacterium]|nr:hypothetical protein [Fimbriimonadaceae bacterium]
MRAGSTSVSSLIAALGLGLLTFGVFFVLQDYGPESALRKFHRAAVNGNLREVSEVVAQDSNREFVEGLAGMVFRYARAGARYQLLHVKRENKRVVAEVAYVLPGRPVAYPVLWVVEKERGGWKVDVNETVKIRLQTYG